MFIISDYNYVLNISDQKYEIIINEYVTEIFWKELCNIIYLDKKDLIYICKELNIDFDKLTKNELKNIQYSNDKEILLFDSNDCKEIQLCSNILDQYMIIEKLKR